jgi:hypothetical protein
MFCPSCGTALGQGSAYCAQCGTKLSAHAPSTGPPSPTNSMSTIDLHRLGGGDAVAAVGTLVLLVTLFLPWYSLSLNFGSLYSGIYAGSISALGDGAGGWRFLTLMVCMAILGYLFARTIWSPRHRLPLPHWQLLTVLCSINLLLTALMFLVRPLGGSSFSGLSISWDYGAYIGVCAAILAVLGSVLRRRQPELLGRTLRAPTPPPPSRSAPDESRPR